MQDYISFEEADFLLKRDWAMDMDNVDELLWFLDEDEFQKVVHHYKEYPIRVRLILDQYMPKPILKSKHRVVSPA